MPPSTMSNENFAFVKTLYDEQLTALTTTMSLRVIHELTKMFNIPVMEFCQYLTNQNELEL